MTSSCDDDVMMMTSNGGWRHVPRTPCSRAGVRTCVAPRRANGLRQRRAGREWRPSEWPSSIDRPRPLHPTHTAPLDTHDAPTDNQLHSCDNSTLNEPVSAINRFHESTPQFAPLRGRCIDVSTTGANPSRQH